MVETDLTFPFIAVLSNTQNTFIGRFERASCSYTFSEKKKSSVLKDIHVNGINQCVIIDVLMLQVKI